MRKKAKKIKNIRLSGDILPVEYDITLRPDLESSTFTGKVVIEINVKNPLNKITLHSKDLDIETCTSRTGTTTQFADKITYDVKKETATFLFKNKITKGKYYLDIVFSGVIKENLRGLYKSKYHIDGKEKFLATTQFEATDARRAFPCFDEPAHKAVFKVSLIIPNHHEAISNTTPIEIKKHEAGYKIVSFSPTPIMSTYLLAFITGEFEYIEGWTKKATQKIHVRVFTTPGKKHQARFALDVAIRALEFYEEYFGIPYPLSNLDMIAIPDFGAAAMENWGAVTYRETAILVDEEHSSLSNKQWAAIVIAHELAHQWFGNLVTMHWWTDLWLNEGFASYMENVCVDHLFPNWHIWNMNLADRYSLALRLDSLSNSHPIEIEVGHPDEINEIFDMVSYAKGSAVIKMLALYLGEDKFREGLKYYFTKHSYKNTETINLWQAFEKVPARPHESSKASGNDKPIKDIMSSWTKQTGYPLVYVASHKQGLRLEQSRFFSSRVARKKNKKRNYWQIPLKYELINKEKKIDKKILLDKPSILIKEENIGKVNKGENSFVRVKYDKNTLEKLKKEIIENRMSTRDRLGLARDMFALAEGGYVRTSESLDFSLSYKNEDEYIVWAEIALGINKIRNIFCDENLENKYNQYVLSLFSPLAEKMTFYKKDNEKHSDTFLRSLALSISANYGDKNVIKEAKKIFINRQNRPIDKDIRGVIYRIVAQNGGIKEWHMFKKMHSAEKMQEEKDRIAMAMTYFKDKNLIEKTLSFALSKEVRGQDAPFLFSSMLVNRSTRDLTWKFMKKNWKVFLERYAEGGHFMPVLLTSLENFKTKKDLVDIKRFFKENLAPGAERTLLQVYERIESNIAWLTDDKKDFTNWLKK